MKRDLELIRKMLFLVEEHHHGFAPQQIQIEGYSSEEIGYHAYLLAQAGLVAASNATHSGHKTPYWTIQSLTSAGHDFIDSARSDTIWNKAKTTLKDNGMSLAIGAFGEYLKSLTKLHLGF
jgi:Hypothetical protein (DUF2513)